MAITNFSQKVFRSDSDQILVPRQKFNFTLILDRVNQGSIVFHRVSSVSVPGYSVDTVMLNQYNKKRVVQTRINYDPITVTFYDTFDNEWHNLMRDYLSHYFNGGEGIRQRTSLEGPTTVNPNFVTDMGFTPNASRYFFPRVKIIQNGYRNRFRETILINPTITAIQGDTLDYSDSNPAMFTVTFQPESIQTQDISSQFDDKL